MDILGTVAAGTLGYIHGNVKGARRWIKSYQQYRKLTMVPKTPSKVHKRRSSMGSAPRTPRRTPSKPMRSRSGSVYKSVGSITHMPGTSASTSVSVRKRGNKVHKEGVKKKVKVSKEFRKKVKEALTGNYIKGKFTDVSYGKIIPVSGVQTNLDLGYSWDNAFSFFSPGQVLHVASVLFNQQLNTQVGLTSNPGLFSIRNMKIDVVKSHVTVKFKNNSARNIHFNVYAVSPKGKLDGNGKNAVFAWSEAMANDGTAGPSQMNISQTFGGARVPASPAQLLVKPTTSPAFSNKYTCDTTTVMLEPGKEYTYYLKGPQPKTYDYAKYWNGLLFDNQQKFIKQIMVSAWVDVTGTDTGAIGRYTNLNPIKGFGLLYEMTQHFTVSLPEQTGIEFTAAPAVGKFPLNLRRAVYFNQNWQNPGAVGVVTEILDENPIGTAVDGI